MSTMQMIRRFQKALTILYIGVSSLTVVPVATDLALNVATHLFLKQLGCLLGLEVGGEVLGMNNTKLHWGVLLVSFDDLFYHRSESLSTLF